METRKHLAAEKKRTNNYNCAQAVICTYCDLCGLDEKTAADLGGAFGSGMGNMEGTCGALIGAGMIAGLKTEGKGTLKVARKIQEEFNARCGSIKCKELKAMTDGKPLCPCEDCVRNAVLIYGEVMGLE